MPETMSSSSVCNDGNDQQPPPQPIATMQVPIPTSPIKMDTPTEKSNLKVETVENSCREAKEKLALQEEGPVVVPMPQASTTLKLLTYEGHGNKSPLTTTTTPPLPSDLVSLSQILTHLDPEEHSSSLLKDSHAIFQNYLFPLSFLWHSPRIRLLSHVPRDIDEMHGILYAGGGLKGDDSSVPSAFRETNRSLSKGVAWGGKAVSRRGDDVGVVELQVVLPKMEETVPRSLLGKCGSAEELERRKWAFRRGELAEVACNLPWCWDSSSSPVCKEDETWEQVGQKRKQQRVSEESRSRYKTWNISVRVAQVTSRRTLFPSLRRELPNEISSDEKNEKSPRGDSPALNEMASGNKKPKLCHALFPAYIQSGRSVIVDSTAHASLESNNPLGSYSCRPNPKKEKNSRIRIHVGRTRRIWTCMKDGGYASLLSGTKLDAAAYKRPREAIVGVRVDGELMTEEEQKNSCEKQLDQVAQSGSSSAEKWSWNNAMCILQRKEYVESCWKHAKKEHKKLTHPPQSKTEETPAPPHPQYVPMKHGTTQTLKHTEPRIECMPLDDGYFRVFSVSAGSMAGVGIFSIFNQMAKKERVCTVCWKGGRVRECVECGLLVHLECCADQGEPVEKEEGESWNDTNTVDCRDKKTEENDPSSSTHNDDSNLPKWRCGICTEHTKPAPKKSRRTPKLPSRFVDETWQLPSSLSGKKPKQRPSYKCTLCPHSGGAMSKNKGGGWTHEVCRVWCGARREGYPHKLSHVCALCGKGGKGRAENENDTGDKSEGRNAASGLVKCAMRGCSVTFHPLCALLTTKLRSEHDVEADSSEDVPRYGKERGLYHIRKKDEQLCRQYSLQLLEVKRTEGSFGTLAGEIKSCIVPIATCGIHNPQRERSFFGCPAGGWIIGSAMRIPTLQLQQGAVNSLTNEEVGMSEGCI